MTMENESMVFDDRDLLVYLCIRRSMSPLDGISSISLRSIAAVTGYTPLSVLRAVEELVEGGYINVVGMTSRRRNMYSFKSTLAARDYSFFEKQMTKEAKAAAARKALVYDDGEKKEETPVGISGAIEDTIGRICAEIEDLRRFKCSVLGQKYVKKEYYG